MSASFRPLDGISVVDISHVIAGPFATFHLAQMGADVLKIENIHGGDVMRRNARGPKAFAALNAGKRKLRLDIAAPAGRDHLIALVRDTDILVDNLRPGVLEGKGLGYAAMQAINPRLIYCSISGFGRSGAASGRPAYDHVVQAATGMTLASGTEGEPPSKIGFPLIDAGAGIIAALAIVSALRERDRTGAGMLLDVSMAGAALQLMYPQTCEALTDGIVPARPGNQAFSGSPAADVFATRDDKWIALAANTPGQLLRLFEVLGLSELARDPALFDPPLTADAPAAMVRAKDAATVKARIRARIATTDAAHLEAALIRSRVPVSRVRTLPEFTAEAEQAGQLTPVELEDEGVTVRSPGLGFRVL